MSRKDKKERETMNEKNVEKLQLNIFFHFL